MDAWKPDLHLLSYLRGEIIPGDCQTTRQLFLKRYTSATKQVCNWLDTLPDAEKQSYQQYVLPLVNPLLIERLITAERTLAEQRERWLKQDGNSSATNLTSLDTSGVW